VILRAAAAVAAALGLAALGAYLHEVGQGPFAPLAARHLRAMKDRDTAPGRCDTLSFAAFAALPHGRPVGEDSALERRGVVLEGWVQRALHAPDGDLHLELAPAPRAPGAPDTLYATCEITPAFRRGAPAWGWERLLQALRPNRGGATQWAGGPRRVRIAGWLLYDVEHEERIARAPGRRLGAWEIHPVTAISVWSDDARAFVELPR